MGRRNKNKSEISASSVAVAIGVSILLLIFLIRFKGGDGQKPEAHTPAPRPPEGAKPPPPPPPPPPPHKFKIGQYVSYSGNPVLIVDVAPVTKTARIRLPLSEEVVFDVNVKDLRTDPNAQSAFKMAQSSPRACPSVDVPPELATALSGFLTRSPRTVTKKELSQHLWSAEQSPMGMLCLYGSLQRTIAPYLLDRTDMKTKLKETVCDALVKQMEQKVEEVKEAYKADHSATDDKDARERLTRVKFETLQALKLDTFRTCGRWKNNKLLKDLKTGGEVSYEFGGEKAIEATSKALGMKILSFENQSAVDDPIYLITYVVNGNTTDTKELVANIKTNGYDYIADNNIGMIINHGAAHWEPLFPKEYFPRYNSLVISQHAK